MTNKEVKKLKELLNKYNKWCFDERDGEIIKLVENIEFYLKFQDKN